MALFDALNVHEHGVGPYRLNRFRIYFRVPEGQGGLGMDLLANFPSYFNPNLATVSFRGDKPWNNRAALRFNLTASLFGSDSRILDYVVPDVHSDWVGVQKVNEPHGFAVQTLKRNFTEGEDLAAAALGFGGGQLATFSPYAGPAAAVAAYSVNQYHFLAGRRAWAVAPAAFFGVANVRNQTEITPDAWALETAAIERFSGDVFRLADFLQVMGDFDEAIRRVWVRLMMNYVSAKGFATLPIRAWVHERNNVSYVEEVHATRQQCEGSSNFTEIVERFPEIFPRNRI